MAYPVTLNGRTYTLADFEGTNYVDGLPDAFEDFVTHAGAIYKTTSTTSNTIGSGSKSFTTADNSLPYQEGTPLRISDGAAPATNWMDGIVTAYSGTSLTVNVVSYAGSGTLTDWDINIGGGGTSYTGTLPIAQGGTGATTAGAAATNLGLGTGDSPTFAGLTVDTDTLHVDSANNRVGIGTASPDTLTLHVQNGAVSGAPSPNTNCDVYIEGTTDTGIQFTSGTQTQLRFGDAASTAAGSIIYNHSDDSLRVSTNGSEAMRIDSNGHLILKKNLVLESTSDGIDFSGVGSSAQTLDSYEEGTYEPELYGASTGTGSPLPIRAAYSELSYTKIGRQVFVTGKVETLGSHSASGALQITLPFAIANQNDAAGNSVGPILIYRTGSGAPYENPVLLGVQATSYAVFYENTSGGDIQPILAQNMDTAIEFFMSITYNAAT
jgi:hypothetical protein